MPLAIEAAKVLQAGEGKPLSVVGETITVKLTGEDTEGRFSIFEGVTPLRGGPPPHIHHREDESFYILEGEFEFGVADRVVRAGPGTTLYGPKDVPHFFRSVGDAPGRMLVIVSPAGLEKLFEEADRLGKSGAFSLEKLMELGNTFGLEFVAAD